MAVVFPFDFSKLFTFFTNSSSKKRKSDSPAKDIGFWILDIRYRCWIYWIFWTFTGNSGRFSDPVRLALHCLISLLYLL